MTSSRFIFLLAENFGSLASTFSPYDSICSKMVIIFMLMHMNSPLLLLLFSNNTNLTNSALVSIVYSKLRDGGE